MMLQFITADDYYNDDYFNCLQQWSGCGHLSLAVSKITHVHITERTDFKESSSESSWKPEDDGFTQLMAFQIQADQFIRIWLLVENHESAIHALAIH